MFNRIDKTIVLAAGAATLLFTNEDGRADQVIPDLVNNFVDIVSLDAEDGSPAEPTVGTYNVYVQNVNDGPWMSIEDNGTINAVDTGGSALADGTGIRASFVGTPIAVKIVADSVDVATHFRATISQTGAV